jgi:small acid-soluble spore protein B (major beta-type SASP)
MSRGSKKNTLVVPEANAAMEQMKVETAQELGIQIPKDGYMGNMTTRDTGSIGGNITKKLVKMGEEQIANKRSSK